MIPYMLAPDSTLPLASFAANTFGKYFQLFTNKNEFGSDETDCAVGYLSDIWALDRHRFSGRSSDGNLVYILDRVLDFCGFDLQSGKCRLVFDLSAEGHPYHKQSFDDLHHWCKSNGILPRHIAILSQNRALGKKYHDQHNSDAGSIRFHIYDQFIAGLANYFALDDPLFAARIGFSKRKMVWRPMMERPFNFLCMNAAPRPIRIAVLAALEASGLLYSTRWSLLNNLSGKDNFDFEETKRLMIRLGRSSEVELARHLVDGPPHLLDSIDVSNSNLLAWRINRHLYESTRASVVTETDFSNGDNIRVTEKLIKALGMGHPSIVFGNPGSLNIVREFGFQTFDPFLCEQYDLEYNPTARFELALNSVRELNINLGHLKSMNFYSMEEIGQFNLNHAHSGRFRDKYESNVERPLLSGLIEMLN